ncbi:hypothetical protein KUTeg_010975 [Tegillarca granosa]|uniref:Uncharacterized protein n=1 Tax=Tegillarca granosa TaxID=220873 RepID=A0ABQ9F5T5_TEGGR|nr:hypothetical protein KUTeg_010975 [Tegillarca granosa]
MSNNFKYSSCSKACKLNTHFYILTMGILKFLKPKQISNEDIAKAVILGPSALSEANEKIRKIIKSQTSNPSNNILKHRSRGK